MLILAIDTSADETSCAVTDGRKVISYINYTQILSHREWGGIVPSIARRAHEERIDWVVEEVCRKAAGPVSRFLPQVLEPKMKSGSARLQDPSTRNTRFLVSMMQKIDYIAVTYGPGLAIALEVGIKKAKELAQKYHKKLIAVNHMEGHIYSSFAQNRNGKPERDFRFPYLALLLSGGHTEIVLFKDHLDYEILGQTRDDAAGEALDKAARMLGLGYPGGPVIERLASEVKNVDSLKFPRPMIKTKEIEFSFSGLKTAIFYYLKNIDEDQKIKNLGKIVSSFQEAVFASIVAKTELAIQKTGVKYMVVGGGVSSNKRLRLLLRRLVRKYHGSVQFPPYPYLTGDNAVMIGIAAFYKAGRGKYVEDPTELDRDPRLSLS